MNRKELEDEIIKLIAEQVCLEVEDISPASDFVNELGFDSLDAVEMIMAIEDKFDISIIDEEAEKLTSVNHVANYLDNYLK